MHSRLRPLSELGPTQNLLLSPNGSQTSKDSPLKLNCACTSSPSANSRLTFVIETPGQRLKYFATPLELTK